VCLDQSPLSKQLRSENDRRACIGSWQVELLPRAPYEVRYTPSKTVIGFSFEAQVGTHAFASDTAKQFHARPNGLACVPAGCDVYSQSPSGGEYLKVVIDNGVEPDSLAMLSTKPL